MHEIEMEMIASVIKIAWALNQQKTENGPAEQSKPVPEPKEIQNG